MLEVNMFSIMLLRRISVEKASPPAGDAEVERFATQTSVAREMLFQIPESAVHESSRILVSMPDVPTRCI